MAAEVPRQGSPDGLTVDGPGGGIIAFIARRSGLLDKYPDARCAYCGKVGCHIRREGRGVDFYYCHEHVGEEFS